MNAGAIPHIPGDAGCATSSACPRGRSIGQAPVRPAGTGAVKKHVSSGEHRPYLPSTIFSTLRPSAPASMRSR